MKSFCFKKVGDRPFGIQKMWPFVGRSCGYTYLSCQGGNTKRVKSTNVISHKICGVLQPPSLNINISHPCLNIKILISNIFYFLQ
jgi:hypothetical protein